MDATQAQTEAAPFDLLKPAADAFRNYFNAKESYRSPTEMLVDKADQLDLTVPEMTVLLGGMRVLNTNTDEDGLYRGMDRRSKQAKFTATSVDLIFGSNSELRAIAEIYAYNNAQERFVNDFVATWVKVMQLDRFNLKLDT